MSVEKNQRKLLGINAKQFNLVFKKRLPVAGFTLIEIVVVIAIIAILALVALPSQISRLNRNKVVESIALVTQYRINILSYYVLNYDFPANNEEAEMPESAKIIGNYLKGLEVEDGAMHIIFGNKFKSHEGEILTIFPVYVEDSPASPIDWVCGYDEVPQGMTAAGTNKTTIEKQNLPVSCR